MGEMTNEQAARWLKDLLKSDLPMEQYQTAIEKGIEALEPSGDLIIREETLTAFADYVGSGMSMNDYEALWDIVEKMPSVKQEPKWIPVSERLPEENETVIASTKHDVYPKARYTKEYGWECIYEPGADYWVELADVTGWMKRNELTLDDSIWSMWPPLSVRARNVLLRAGFRTIGDVLKCSRADLMRVRNMGRKSFEEVEKRFSKYGKFNGEG